MSSLESYWTWGLIGGSCSDGSDGGDVLWWDSVALGGTWWDLWWDLTWWDLWWDLTRKFRSMRMNCWSSPPDSASVDRSDQTRTYDYLQWLVIFVLTSRSQCNAPRKSFSSFGRFDGQFKKNRRQIIFENPKIFCQEMALTVRLFWFYFRLNTSSVLLGANTENV